MIHLIFTFDDQSDLLSPDDVRQKGDILIDAMLHPDKPRPEGEWVGGEFARQYSISSRSCFVISANNRLDRFWLRLPSTTETFRRRILKTWIDYVESVPKEAEDRFKAHILDLESYWTLRRRTSAVAPTMALNELDIAIPDDVRDSAILRQLEAAAVDIIYIANVSAVLHHSVFMILANSPQQDILSYNKEQAAGQGGHNIITVIMKQFQVDVQQAIDKAGRMICENIEAFNTLYRELPRWVGPLDLEVQRLVDGFARWVSGSLHWSYESHRYFGTRGLEVKEARLVELMPHLNVVEVPVVSSMRIPQGMAV